MDTGDSLFGLKIRGEKSKTRSSKKERSLSSKQDRGDDTTSRRSRRSHRSVTGERMREKEPVDRSLLSLLNEESQRRSKKSSPEKRHRRDRSDSLSKKKEVSRSRQARSKSSHRKAKSSSRRPRSVTKDRSENQLKTVTKDVKFDKNAKSNEHINIGDKSVLSVKRKSESRDKSSKSKSGDRREKSGVPKTGDKHKDKKESRTRRDKSGDQSKTRIKTKDKSDAVPQESIKEKHLKERDKSEKRKEKIHKERREKKRAEAEVDTIDSITIICRPEKKRKSRRSSFFEEEFKSAYELTKKKDHGEKEVKRNKENKDEKKERKKKRISEKLEGRQSEKSSSRRSEKRASSRSERPENLRSEKTEKHSGTRSENTRTEKRESRRVVKPETSHEKLDRHSEKRSSRRSEKTDAEREERIRRKSKQGEVERSGSRERKRKVRQKEQCDDEVFEETGATGDFRKQTMRTDDNQRETNLELVESFEEPSDGQFKETAPTCSPRSQLAETVVLKQIKGNSNNHKDLSAKPIETEESARNVLRPDKYIKITNKEDILRKGVQDLTVKELYLMENLKDYEIKMNEQFLRKIKKKKQEQHSVSDNVGRQHFRQESPRHSLTNMSIYRLPSVKEIFKISNLVDYEKKCKEMRERKKMKCTDTRTDPDYGYLTSLGRKKLTKFSLESKEDEASNKKKDSSKLSSQWILNNFRRTTVKNEGGGEEIICNLSLILDNENKKQDKNLETGDARGPNRVREITRGLRTTSKTKLAIREMSRYSCDLEENANYFKMCENFRHNIREESKRLLQNMAENKNVRISIKDSSLQSIKKKPSLQSDDTLGALDSRNFDYVLLKKSKQNLEEGYSFMSGDTRKKFEMCDDAVCERLNRKEEVNDEISWNVVSRRQEFGPNNVPRTFEKNVNKNAGVFINNHHKPEFVPPGNFIGMTSKYQPEQFSSEGNYSSYTADYNLNRALSNSSYTLSMFERDRDPSDPHRYPVDSNLNHCNISREDPEMSLSRKRDLAELKPDEDAWFHRAYTLERIINEIKDSPEKDTDPPSKVLRECRFDNRCNKAFPEIEKSKNVLLNYMNGNPNAQAKEIDCHGFNEDKKIDHLVFSEFDDHLGKSKRYALKETKYRDSLSCLREIESFDRRRQTDSSLSSGKLEQYPCMVNGRSCVICSRSCVSIRTFRNENNKKPCRNFLKASLHNSSATFKCDLKAEEEANMINTKLVITDPVAKKSNILQIQFCGKLNINFNKDNIELGNVNSVCCEHQKPVEIKYSDDSTMKCARVNEVVPTTPQPGPDSPLETSQSPLNQHVSQECVRQSSYNNVQLNRSTSQSSDDESESSKTVIFRKEQGGNEPPVENQTELKMDKDTQNQENKTSDDTFNSNSVSNSAEPKNDDIMDHSITGGSEALAVGSQPEEGNEDQTADGESKQTDDANGAVVSQCVTEPEVKSLSELEGQEEKEATVEDPKVESSTTEAQDIGQELQLEPEAKTVVNEDSKEVGAENIVDAFECDKVLNLDASVQTINSPRYDLTVFKKSSSTLGRNVQTCTSSIFEPKENAGNKSMNTCTFNTVSGTPVICISSINMASLNKEKETGSQPQPFTEKPKGKILREKKTVRLPGANVNFKLPVPKITSPKGNVASFDSESIMNECKKHTPNVQNSNCSTVQNHLANEVVQNKKFDEKKKLLLSQSEEDAFKYLLLKGIGRTEGCEGKSSEDTVEERSDGSQQPKFMFSAIKRRVEYYKNKASGSKLSDSSGESRANAANLSKSATVEDRRRHSWRPNEYSTCSCNHRQRTARVWDHQRPKSRKQLFDMEPQYTHLSQGYGPMKPHSCRPPAECSAPGNVFCPRYSPDYRTTEQFEPKDQAAEMVEYNLKNLHSQAEKYRMRTFNKYVLRQSPHESVFEPNCSGASTLQEHYKGENGKDVGSVNLHHGFCGRTVCEAEKSVDLSPWGDSRRDFTGNASLPLINLPTDPRESSYCLFPQQSYPCEQVRSRISDSVQSEQQVPPPTEPPRQTLTDAVLQKDVDKQSSSTKLLVTDSLQETAHKVESIVVCNMQSSASQENSDQTELNHQTSIDVLENKKPSTKIKFSKQASKLWKSLFKKNKRMNDDLLEYETIAPEHFIAKRPKVQEKKLKITKWLKKISQGKTTDFQHVQDKLFKKLNKIMTSEVTMPLQEVFDLIQKPQFHKDNHSYSGRIKFDKVNTSNYLSDDGNYIMITEQLNVRGFLASIGLKDDVAWEAQDNPELNARLQSAITEARSWVNKITMSQGLLIYILAVMTPVEVNNYYLQIVEAVINNRISNVGTLLSVVMVLKRYERGKYGIKTVISKEHVKDLVPKQISDTEKRHLENRTRFINLYNTAKRAAGKINMKVDKESAGLLARLTASYSPGLKPYLSLLAHYIAQKIITDKGLLSMAVSYLQSLNVKHFDQETFEQHCGLAHKKVVFKGTTHKILPAQEGQAIKHPEKSNMPDRVQASWVKRKKTRPPKDSTERIGTDASILERKPSTMNLLKG